MAENAVVESSIMVGIPYGMIALIHAINDDQTVLDDTFLVGVGEPSSLWGSMVWGSGTWGAITGVLEQRRISWQKPLVFKQAAFVLTIKAALGVAIGNLYIKYQVQGYQLPPQPIPAGYLLDANQVPILDASGNPIMV
jgi:hypothetical protein